VVLSEHNVIDPVRVCLDLVAELGRRRFEVGGIGVGERVAFVCVGLVEVEMEVPCAYYAVAATRVAIIPCQSG
jgi:hypothetical protein